VARSEREKGQRVADQELEAQGRPAGRAAAEPTSRGGGAIQFIRECWAELQRVQWPNRRELWTATGVVILVCLVMGVYLGALDAVLTRASSWLVRQYASH